jgi:serine/threonine protein kinase
VEPHCYQDFGSDEDHQVYRVSFNGNLNFRNLSCHDPIVAYLGYYEKQLGTDKAPILIAGCPEGDLFNVRSLTVKRNKHFFSDGIIWSVFSQLVGALAFLHEGIDAQIPLGRAHWRLIVHRISKLRTS